MLVSVYSEVGVSGKRAWESLELLYTNLLAEVGEYGKYFVTGDFHSLHYTVFI